MDNTTSSSLELYQPRNYLRRFFFVMLISTTFTIVISLQRGRSVILENFVENQQQRDKSSKLISCTMRFIKEYFGYSDRMLLLLPDLSRDIPHLVKLLINELHMNSTVYTLNRAMNITRTYNASKTVAILSEEVAALKRNDFCFKDLCKNNCNFIIMLTDLFIDKEMFTMEAKILIQRIWSRSIFKLMILASVEDAILFIDGLPVPKEELLASVEPVLLGRCEWTSTTMQWQYLGKMKSSPRNCVVNAAMFDNFPYAVLVNDTNYLRFSGIEGLIVEEVARSMEVELNRERIIWTNQTAIADELYLRLYNSTKDDLVFGGLLWDPNMEIDYTSPYGMVHITWMVPIKTNVSLRGLITPFSANVWYAIVCVLIIGGITKLLFIRDISFLEIAALVFGVATLRQPVKTSRRIHFISWALFGFFLTQLYLGSLADQLTNASNLQIESMEELLSSGLKIGGTTQLADLLEEFDKDDEEHGIRQKIRENLIVFEQHAYINHMLDIVEGKNTSLALLVMLNITNIHDMPNLGYAHVVKKTIGSYPLAFATWRGFPYLNDINLKIQAFIQVGLIEFWADITTTNKNYYEAQDSNDSNLDLEELVPAFLLLVIGYLGGCCLLILEVIFHPSQIFL